MSVEQKLEIAVAARAPGRGRDRGGLPDLLAAAVRRPCKRDRRGGEGPTIAAWPGRWKRTSTAPAEAARRGRAAADPHLPRHLPDPHGAQAAEGPGRGRSRWRSRPCGTRATGGRGGVLPRGRHAHGAATSCAGSSRRSSRPGPPCSTSPTRSATPSPRVRRLHPRLHARGRPNIDKAVISVHCHNDLGWRWPTRWPPCGPAPGRSSHGQRHRRARRQRRARGGRHGARRCARDILPYTTGVDTQQIYKTSASCRSMTGFASSATRPSWARTPSPTNPASTRTACSRSGTPTRS